MPRPIVQNISASTDVPMGIDCKCPYVHGPPLRQPVPLNMDGCPFTFEAILWHLSEVHTREIEDTRLRMGKELNRLRCQLGELKGSNTEELMGLATDLHNGLDVAGSAPSFEISTTTANHTLVVYASDPEDRQPWKHAVDVYKSEEQSEKYGDNPENRTPLGTATPLNSSESLGSTPASAQHVRKHGSKFTINPNRPSGSRLQQIVNGPFDIVVACVIFFSTLVVCVQMEWEGYNLGISIGYKAQVSEYWAPDAGIIFLVFEHMFNIFFLIEIVLRIIVLRCLYLRDASNLFDMAIVLATSVNMYILMPLQYSQGANLSFLRMLRYVRLVRVLRVVRTMRLCTQLRLLVHTIASSLQALFWSLVLLVLFMLMGSMFLCQSLQNYIETTDDHETRNWVYMKYGTSLRAWYTMFEVTFSGGWNVLLWPLIERVNGLYGFFVIAYICFVVFSVIRIITALFLKETLTNAALDAEITIHEKKKSKQVYIEKLEALFNSIDVSGDGVISKGEFDNMMQHPEIVSYLEFLELDTHEVHSLFALLDDGDGQIEYTEFITSVMQLQGQARSQDVIAIMSKCKVINKDVQEIKVCLQSLQTDRKN